ncbi:MAG TPA: GNAT family N-acetyltransferase [Solirubrobacterales bacterium]
MRRRAQPEVRDNPDRGRFELLLDGRRVGYIRYRRFPDRIDLIHTEILPRHEGKGNGGVLIAAALAQAREEGLAVIPHCPFVREYIEQHPAALDLVPAGRRAEFGLPD